MNNLILIRHGMSYWNKAKRFTGWADIDLHDEGKSEAKRAGQLVKDLQIEFDVYFTSQLKRAINSLNIILEVLGKSNVEINKAWELNERHYGNLTSLNKEEIKKKFGNKQVQIWRRSFNTRPPPMDKQHPYREEKKNYIQEIIRSDLEEAGQEDVFRKIKKDFQAASITVEETEIRDQMTKALLRAKEDFKK